jgi:hypothetical protein
MNRHPLVLGARSLAALSYIVVTQSTHAWSQRDLEDIWRGGDLVDGPTEASRRPHCRLDEPGAVRELAKVCRACHRGLTAHDHLIDVDYPATRQKRPGAALRTESDASERGVLLRDGKIRCGTCHDARALPYKLVLPPPRLCLACHAFE